MFQQCRGAARASQSKKCPPGKIQPKLYCWMQKLFLVLLPWDKGLRTLGLPMRKNRRWEMIEAGPDRLGIHRFLSYEKSKTHTHQKLYKSMWILCTGVQNKMSWYLSGHLYPFCAFHRNWKLKICSIWMLTLFQNNNTDTSSSQPCAYHAQDHLFWPVDVDLLK